MSPHRRGWLTRWWSGAPGTGFRALDVLLWPLEAVYRSLAGLRASAYRAGALRVVRASVPVVSVGNLTVGGTGKTPFTAFLAARLIELGRAPGVVLRGYGADEVALHRRWMPNIPVVADPRRDRGVRTAVTQGAGVVVLDDGFQHLRLDRTLDVVLLSAEQEWAMHRGRVLPRGPLREAPAALDRADLIVVTHRAADPTPLLRRLEARVPQIPWIVAHLTPGGWLALDGTPLSRPEGAAVAVASIADPDSFGALLRGAGVQVDEHHWFPDHHPYTERDIAAVEAWAAARTLITTEKDAVKLIGRTTADWRVLRLQITVDGPDQSRLDQLLKGLP